MRWSEFEEDEPRLAALGRQRLVDPGVLLMERSAATGRRGSARSSR